VKRRSCPPSPERKSGAFGKKKNSQIHQGENILLGGREKRGTDLRGPVGHHSGGPSSWWRGKNISEGREEKGGPEGGKPGSFGIGGRGRKWKCNMGPRSQGR